MKTITILFSILVLSLVSASANAESPANTEEYYAYEDVPVYDGDPPRIGNEDWTLSEGMPTYEEDLLEEAELATFEVIEEMQE